MPKEPVEIFGVDPVQYKNLCGSIGTALMAQMKEEDGDIDPGSLMACALAALSCSLLFIQIMEEAGGKDRDTKGLIIALETVNELYKASLKDKFNCKIDRHGRIRFIS